jgi:hypothetical protein
MRQQRKRASQKAFHVVYKTTCLTTGKWYIGLHSTDNMNDGYLGSGMRLTRSVKKYGENDHTREILFMGNTRKDASNKEAELLSEEVRKDPMCMNLGLGGLGATDRPATSEETAAKLSKASKGYVRTKEWYAKILASRMANNGYNVSDETKEKIRTALTGKTLSEEHKKKISEGGTGQKRSEETCQNISKSLKGKIWPKGKDRKPVSEEAKENIRKSRIGKKHSEEAKANMRKPHKAPKTRSCTVDGINIFESVKAMVEALGSGQNSRRSPNFRYVKE